MVKLTKEQRKLVEDNHNLIWFTLKTMNLKEDDMIDSYGAASFGLCRAAKSYDKTISPKFSTFAIKCITNELLNAIRDEKRHNVICSIYLDEEFTYKDDDSELTLYDTLSDESFNSKYQINKFELEKVYNELNERNRKICKMILEDGYTQVEVGKIYNLTKQSISLIYNDFIKRLKPQMVIN